MKIKECPNTFSCDFTQYPDTVWLKCREKPFTIYGLYKPYESEHFMRIPQEVAERTNDGVKDLNYQTSGGRITFSTDSPYIAIHSVQPTFNIMRHMPRSGNAGFDLYLCDEYKEQIYAGSLFASVSKNEYYYTTVNSRTSLGKKQNYVLNFPLYERCDDVYIGFHPDSEVDVFEDAYTGDAPLVFYGSSITQGGCVSRPGLVYTAHISRKYHRDYINLGFSGSCKGEDAICEYMAGLNMSVFVCDYDHNAPNPDHLRKTHYKVYETIRKKQPDLPYVMVSKPDVLWYPGFIENKNIIIDSYSKALALGDKNVYFVDGSSFFEGDYYDSCTVDTTHPNDLGHYLMAKYIGETIGEIISKEKQ